LINGVSQNRANQIDAISGYAGAEGVSSPANLGIQDTTFASGAESIGVSRETKWYVRPLRGMQHIPVSLAEAYTALKGKLSLNNELIQVTHVNPTADGAHYILTFRRTWSNPCNQVTSFQGPGAGEIYNVSAKKVILAVTKNALNKILFIDSTGKLQDDVTELLDSVGSAPAMKYFASYPERWWETFAKKHHPKFPNDKRFNVSRITGSAQIQNLFAWYPGTQQAADQPRACSDDKMGVIQNYITGFADWTYAGVLDEEKQLRCKEVDVSQCQKCFNEDTGFVGPAKNHAPKGLSDAMRQQQATLFGLMGRHNMSITDIPEPTEVMYQLWSNSNPVTQTDATHYFKAGYKNGTNT